jgi:3-hydroxyisobutyrate dehydrogenase
MIGISECTYSPTQDLGLAQNASTAVQAPTPLGSLAHQIYRMVAQNPDTATKDFSVVYQMLKKQQKGA